MANTIAAGLVNDYMATGLINVAANKLAPWKNLSYHIEPNPLAPRATVNIPKATVGATAQSNATNWESGDSTLAEVSVSMNQLSVSFHLTNEELNQGSRLEHLAEINAQNLCDKISDSITALFTVANYGAARVVGAASNFDAADLPPILAAAKNYSKKQLVLDSAHLAYLLPTDKNSFRLGEQGAYGFDVIAENSRWTDAVANCCGVSMSPAAVVVASGQSVPLPRGQYGEVNVVQLPQLGLRVQSAAWFNTASRTWWASYDVMLGVAVGDASAGELLITA